MDYSWRCSVNWLMAGRGSSKSRDWANKFVCNGMDGLFISVTYPLTIVSAKVGKYVMGWSTLYWAKGREWKWPIHWNDNHSIYVNNITFDLLVPSLGPDKRDLVTLNDMSHDHSVIESPPVTTERGELRTALYSTTNYQVIFAYFAQLKFHLTVNNTALQFSFIALVLN